MKSLPLILATMLVASLVAVSSAEVKVTTGQTANNSGFSFAEIPAPANNDAATSAQVTLIDGARDPNGGELAVLHNGRVPSSDDHPAQNFFFRAGTDGGRIRVDLGQAIPVKQVCSYSWHAGPRAPQVYRLYAADGSADGFDGAPRKGTDPKSCGWTLVATVDTRSKEANDEGQHGVAISDSAGVIGKYRYLLFDISRTEDRDDFGNTFFSEIDVIDASGPAPTTLVEKPILKSFATQDGKYKFVVDATGAPDLVEWTEARLKPVILDWYPKIVEMLPSEGYQAPTTVTFRFRSDMRGTPASASGAGVNLNTQWFRGQLEGEACGAVVHELVHVVQSYWGRRAKPRATATPGWVVEGIADYVRWFVYEPQSRGAEITKRNIAKANYDSSYRVTANFLNWVAQTYDKDLIRKLNAAARDGRFEEAFWEDLTGKSIEDLGQEWKKAHAQRLNAE